MVVVCVNCGCKATFVESDEHEVPFFPEGHFECNNCGNEGRVTDGTHEGNRLNGFVEV